MQNKKYLILIICSLLFLSFGILLFNLMKNVPKNAAQNEKATTETSNIYTITATPESLKAALDAGKKIECTFIKEPGEVKINKDDPNSKTYKTDRSESTVYFEGNKYKYIGKQNLLGTDLITTMLFDGDTFFRWDDMKETSGIKVTSACMNKFGGNETKEIPLSMEDIINKETGSTTSNCKEIAEPIHISIPTDKTLLDPCNPPKEAAPAGSLQWKLDAGEKMKCTSDLNGIKTEAYLEGGEYKSTTTTSGGMNMTIFDGKAVYSWNPTTKEASKLTIDCVTEAGKDLHTGSYKTFGDIYANELITKMSTRGKCEEINDNIDFAIPADLNFIDQCAAMKNAMNTLKR